MIETNRVRDFVARSGTLLRPRDVAVEFKLGFQEMSVIMLGMARDGQLVRTNGGLYSVPGLAVQDARGKSTITPKGSKRRNRFPPVENKAEKLLLLQRLERLCAEDHCAVLEAIRKDISRLDRYAKGGS